MTSAYNKTAETSGARSSGNVAAVVSATVLIWSNSYFYALEDKINIALENFVAKFRLSHPQN